MTGETTVPEPTGKSKHPGLDQKSRCYVNVPKITAAPITHSKVDSPRCSQIPYRSLPLTRPLGRRPAVNRRRSGSEPGATRSVSLLGFGAEVRSLLRLDSPRQCQLVVLSSHTVCRVREIRLLPATQLCVVPNAGHATVITPESSQPWASAALAAGQRSSSIRVTRSCRPKDVETRHTMGHESFLRAWVLNTPNHGAELSFVNNVSGNHS